jgi:tellurite resistance protein TehA-like permease
LRVVMTDWGLFWKKTLAVFGLSLLVIPLVELRGGLPAIAYMVGLVVLHAFVLVIYFYRIRFRELDPDTRSLIARIGALAVMVYLLTAVTDFQESTPMSTLVLQMLGVSLLHTVVLALLMLRLEHRGTYARAVGPMPERASEN